MRRSSHGTVEKFQCFDVHQLHRIGALREPLVSLPYCSFTWPGLVRVTANRWRVDVTFREGALQRITLTWTRCHFGGWRPWLICGTCNTRVGKLYNSGASLRCRRCIGLWYASQRRGARSRLYLQALRLRLRLNGVANLREPIPPRPRRMHRKTYQRLRSRLELIEEELCASRFISRETDYSPLVPK
jgi:hypothetical protein